ncbi:MAG TPA: hypothetical protein PKL92_00030 [Aquaticitalea sp.]|nr:hypothetical protein [Aquaticitalea sp.]
MKKLAIFIFGAIIGVAVQHFATNENLENMIVKPPKGVITPEEAKDLDAAFDPRHRLIGDSILKRPDNRSAWYSLDDMRNYLEYAQEEVKGLGYAMTGIRIYLGAYPEEDGMPGYTTMFLVPTGKQNLGKSSILNINMSPPQEDPDIPKGPVLNMGGTGNPPSANYPQ